MRKTIEKIYCDICGAECDKVKEINYPVIFHTEQTEGRSCAPYISNTKIDVCTECCKKILKLSATGAQGYNHYEMVGEGE